MSVNGQDLLYDGLTDPRPAVQSSSKCRYEIVAQIFGCEGVKVIKFEEVEKGLKGLVETDGPELMNLIVSIKPTTVNGGSDEGSQLFARSLWCHTTTMCPGHSTRTAENNPMAIIAMVKSDDVEKSEGDNTTRCATIPKFGRP
ncbi:unnamed protein product [Zymoseptoria tritici ST99CH_1E4]|uniref:Uncharacterized protein n=1 Tax=Zymoseptoria tritici ST99CH_1E4 TaxID=1276532 RepID=A0A2H1GAQ9_ZYMTR|nr:unnamed protein product [Zymoseptoria tritici ST99CH_1E4]